MEPPQDLCEKIIRCIHREERLLFVKKIVLSSGVIIFVFFTVGGAGFYVQKQRDAATTTISPNIASVNNELDRPYIQNAPYSKSKVIFYTAGYVVK